MNVLDAVTGLGLTSKKVSSTRGGEYAGACPKCGGRDRFRVWPEAKNGEGTYWCRRCGSSGDLVQFLVDFRGLDYPSAFKEAGRKESFPCHTSTMPESKSNKGNPIEPRSFKPKQYEDPIEAWQVKAEKFVMYAHEKLLANKQEREKLSARGIGLDAISSFGLGWFPGEKGQPHMFRPRESWGLPSIVSPNGRNKKLWIPRGIVIPWFKNGKLQRVRIRRPGYDLNKPMDIRYYILPGSTMEPLVVSPSSIFFVVVEAELDGMLISDLAGDLTGVVALGSVMTKPGKEFLPHLENASRIIVALDSDTAGAKGWKWWREFFKNAIRWPVPVGKDPGDAFKAGINIRDWIEAGLI